MERLKAYIEKHKPKIEKALEEFWNSKIKEVEDPFNEFAYKEAKRFLLSSGKRLRPILVLLGFEGLTGSEPDETVVRVSTSFELLHAYLLTHDDVIDEDEVRRNEPTVWKRVSNATGYGTHFGYSLAILIGDILRTGAFSVLEGLKNLDDTTKSAILRYLNWIDEMTNRGQVLDVYLTYTPLEQVRKEDVIGVYYYKTALYSVNGPLGLGALLAGSDKDFYRNYAIPVGIAFQIRDDIIGTFGDPEKTGKPVDSDIKGNKKTILVWYAYNHANEREKAVLESVLGNKDATPEEVQQVRDIFVSTGALDYAEELAEQYAKEALEALETLEIQPQVKEILREFALYTIKRAK